MQHAKLTGTAVQPVPTPLSFQKFGRIEAVTPLSEGTEIDIRQPDGSLLVGRLDRHSVDDGSDVLQIGRNIWLSGPVEGGTMRVATFRAFCEEL